MSCKNDLFKGRLLKTDSILLTDGIQKHFLFSLVICNLFYKKKPGLSVNKAIRYFWKSL